MNIKKGIGCLATAFMALASWAATVDCEFATIEHPDEWDPASGKGFQVVVTPKESAAEQDLSVHLHWMRINGYGGETRCKVVWGGGLKDDSADCGLVTLVP